MENLVKNRILGIIGEQLDINVDDIKLKSKFFDDLGGDSLDMLELMMLIEEEFDINIPDNEIEKFSTVQSIVKYIQKHHSN